MVTEEVSVEVDSEDVDTPWRKGLLSAVGHAVRLRHDATLSWRNDVLPVRIDADAEDASVVMSVLVIFFFFFLKNSKVCYYAVTNQDCFNSAVVAATAIHSIDSNKWIKFNWC